jgi:hypothetical protein
MLVISLHLTGKHVVLVGDSLMRYQYLSLVTALEKGKFETLSTLNDPTWQSYSGPWSKWNDYFPRYEV